MDKTLIGALLSLFAVIGSAAAAEAPATLDDIAFLEGAWRGGEDFIFEETWSAPAGGVMTAMARGHQGGALRVLEYIVLAEDEAGLLMRFKHFNADYSTWEEDGPVTLRLTEVKPGDVTFAADPPSETVQSIRYWRPSEDALQVDVVVVEDGVEDGFSLVLSKVD